MPTKLDIMLELDRRGIAIPEDKRALFEEYKRRQSGESGVTNQPTYTDPTTGREMPQVQGEVEKPEVDAINWETVKGNIKSGLEGNIESMNRITEMGRRPALEAGGMAVGELVGAVGGEGGRVTGGATGYAVGKRIADIADGKRYGFLQSFTDFGEDIKTGAEMEMAGGVIAKSVAGLAGAIGKTGKELLGATTGTGKGTIEEALVARTKAGSKFIPAMRGEISGEQVVDTARDALQAIKHNRANAYQADLAKVSQVQTSLNAKPIANKLGELMKNYNVTITPKGKIDTSKIAMGKAGRNDIVGVIKEVANWTDNSPTGLDILKRRLDDFYSDSSQARGFVASLRKTIADTISDQVPQYGQMTKKYAEATNLIKDVEAGLMLKKQGMSGRITGDQTLRRLQTAMRENFEMRKELVEALGVQSGEDIASAIAGYSSNQAIPRGLVGKLSGGSIVGFVYLNPKFWPLIAVSSPRAVGEFLTVYGKYAQSIGMANPAFAKTGAMSIIHLDAEGNEIDNR